LIYSAIFFYKSSPIAPKKKNMSDKLSADEQKIFDLWLKIQSKTLANASENLRQRKSEITHQMSSRGLLQSGIAVSNHFDELVKNRRWIVDISLEEIKRLCSESSLSPSIEFKNAIEMSLSRFFQINDWTAHMDSAAPGQRNMKERFKNAWENQATSEKARLKLNCSILWDEIELKPKNEAKNLENNMHKEISVNKRNVFVVHGRNQAANLAMFQFLRSIDLNPIEWSTAVQLTGTATPYTSEVLKKAFSQAQAVVVLLTGDDEAKLNASLINDEDQEFESRLMPQARPNVLFEAGMAFGTHPDRTIIVELGRLRQFSDLGGRNIIRLDNSTKKRQDLADRLALAGCAVNLRGRTDWHNEGNFEVHVNVPKEQNSQPEELILESTDIEILKIISKFEDCTSDDIAKRLSISKDRATYFIYELINRDVLSKTITLLGPETYYLQQKGRKFLVEKNLI